MAWRTWHQLFVTLAAAIALLGAASEAAAQTGGKKPNILVVFGDDVGQANISVFTHGLMGYTTHLRVPKLFNLRADPYERADVTSNTYYDWLMSDGAAAFLASPAVVGKFLGTFKEYPPSQRPSSFSIDQLVEKMQRSFETK